MASQDDGNGMGLRDGKRQYPDYEKDVGTCVCTCVQKNDSFWLLLHMFYMNILF